MGKLIIYIQSQTQSKRVQIKHMSSNGGIKVDIVSCWCYCELQYANAYVTKLDLGLNGRCDHLVRLFRIYYLVSVDTHETSGGFPATLTINIR